MLRFHRQLLALRRAQPALQVGEYRPVGQSGDCFAFVREHRGERLLVAVNLGHSPGALDAEGVEVSGTVVFGTDPAREEERIEGRIRLARDEGIVVRLDT
jgi:alpha-glucosidase